MRRLIVILVLVFGLASAGQAEVRHFTIIHTNDIHGHLEPFVDKTMQEAPVGGVATMATEIRKLRREYPHSLLLDGGDIAQGTPISNLFFGIPVVEFLNSQHYDARTIGNHEFDWGLDHLQAMIDASTAPIVCANLTLKATDKLLPHVRPYVIRQVGGLSIGILGLVTPDTPQFSFPKNVADVNFLSPADTVRHYLPKMRKDGAQVIVLLTHLGVDADTKLASDVPGLDVIVGGHSHTPLFTPVTVGHTVIVQAGCYTRYVGLLQIAYDTQKHEVVEHTDHDELIPMDTRAIPPDPAAAALVSRYEKQIDSKLKEPVGTLADDLPRGDGSVDGPLGDVIADALREETGADMAFYNFGGIRGTLQKGTVDWEDIYTVLPFDNYVVTLSLTGRQLDDLLQHGTHSHHLLQVSGAEYAMDAATLQAVHEEVGGNPLDPSKTYTVATVDFLYLGGDGFTGLPQESPARYGRLARDVLADYLRHHAALHAPAGGRVRQVDKERP